MNITVNGKPIELKEPATIAGLLEVLGLSNRRVAVEHNLKILQPDSYATTALAEGDVLEIVGFVGGG
jgi:sulfur carrier protein